MTEISSRGFVEVEMCSELKSYGKISDPVFSYMKGIVDSGPWTVAVSWGQKVLQLRAVKILLFKC